MRENALFLRYSKHYERLHVIVSKQENERGKRMNKKKISFLIGGAVGVLFVGFLLFAVQDWTGTSSSVVAQPSSTGNTITVQGEGSVHVEPDIVYIQLGVEKTNSSAQKAQQQVNATMNKVRETLASFDIEEENIQTKSLGVHPEYRHGEDGEQQQLYRARHIVEIKYDEMDKVGEVIDQAVNAGANRMEHTRFALQDPTESEQKALQQAIASTEEKANAMAESAGKKKGDVLHIKEHGTQVDFPVRHFSQEEMADSANTTVEAGEIEVVQQVSVVYQLQ